MHHHYIDQFAQGDSPIHRLDARAKLLAVVLYTAVLVSFSRYEVAAMGPMAVLPVAMLVAAQVPLWFALRRVLYLSPFIAFVCLMCPLYDRLLVPVSVGGAGFAIAAGWLTAANIGIKFALGLMALTVLMCTTPFSLLLEAMRKLGVPQLLVVQLGFLYRYIFVLIDEAMRTRRARDFRGAGRAPVAGRLAAVGGIIGNLFVRTLERSERIHVAMCARGYRGTPHSLSHLHFHAADAALLAATVVYLAACRWLYPAILSGAAHG